MFTATKRQLIAVLVVSALSCPAAAYAMPIRDPGLAPQPVANQEHRLDRLQRNVQQLFTSQGGSPTAPSSPPAGRAAGGAFQRDDAGIGAAGTLAVLLGAGAVALGATRRRRTHCPVIG